MKTCLVDCEGLLDLARVDAIRSRRLVCEKKKTFITTSSDAKVLPMFLSTKPSREFCTGSTGAKPNQYDARPTSQECSKCKVN